MPSYLPSHLKALEPSFNEDIVCGKYETVLNDLLLELLEDLGQGLSPSELAHRASLLRELGRTVVRWVRQVMRLREKGALLTPEVDGEPSRLVQVQPYGSYRQGVHLPGADIDLVLVVPAYVQRHGDFFGDAPHSLESLLMSHDDSQEVNPIPDARIPVIKLKFQGISMDLLLCRVTYLPDGLLPPEATLEKMLLEADLRIFGLSNAERMLPEDAYSLDGYRVALLLRQLIHPQQYPQFQVALKWVKVWAEERGIYSNALGFLGGVNFVILLAKVCMWLPSLNAGAMLLCFFVIFAAWDWGEPVMLLEPEEDLLCYDSWGYENLQHGAHILDRNADFATPAGMGIITPGYPAQNSTYNVDAATLGIIRGELQRAAALAVKLWPGGSAGGIADVAPLLGGDTPGVGQGEEGPKSDQGMEGLPEEDLPSWVDFIEPYPFFEKYANYIELILSTSKTSSMLKLKGLVTARLRHLVAEAPGSHFRARAWPRALKPPEEAGQLRTAFLIALEPLHQHAQQYDIRDWRRKLYEWKGWESDMAVDFNIITSKQFGPYIQQEQERHAARRQELQKLRRK